jgi:hypothetical protein
VWKKHLTQLQQQFPEAIKLYRPATTDQISQTEQCLGLKLAEMDPDWLELLRLTNGASVLAYCYMGAMTSHIASITEVNTELWAIELYRWVKERFVCFLRDCSPMMIGFVREGRRMRCIAFLSEPTDTVVLPIASSFKAFMSSFLHDVETALQLWKPVPGEEWPYGISDIWPLDLKSWCDRDPALRTMLQQGVLDDLFRHNDEYTAIVESVLQD